MSTTSSPPDETSAGGASTYLDSPDGRSFRVRGSWTPPRVGDFLHLESGGSTLLGQVERLQALDRREHVASGTLVSVDGPPPAPVPTPVEVSPASDEEVAAVVSGSDRRLHVGRLQSMPEVPLGLISRKLNRHTFWCGQSGSGKTYALGVVLERILAATDLPVLVLDPNSDFVHLHTTVPTADPAESRELADRDVQVLRPDSDEHPLRIRFTDLSARAKAAVLRLDPIIDRVEYNALLQLAASFEERNLVDVLPTLREAGTPEAVMLAQRLENLGLLDWRTVWSDHTTSATDVLDRRPAATVLDLGGYDEQEEQLAVALGVLDHLWQRRSQRRPLLIVVDEAHNLCPPQADTPLGVAVRDRLVQIAAEGRKYGLWLLVSTQRPSKVHPGIVTQCDNLTLMRMTSRSDLEQLASIFGHVPEDMLRRAAQFRLGEALVAGTFVPRPSLVRMRDRVTEQGGSDVSVPLREDPAVRSRSQSHHPLTDEGTVS
ncbi:ATP-binding protein [uncultured Serinicoccus sp.]|uniref:ATP-binding protein n=1 Tax=uncultured Serinicoccus sp. TaxID=735514 RepID=UPI00260AEC7B|nr:ATP-binding protein [uncultured Serinicoccus sp.]